MALTHREMLDLWPSREALAAELGMDGGNVRLWRHADRIPLRHWERLVAAAERWGIKGVTLEALRVAALAKKAERSASGG